jgi:GTP pyrophosphokinase
MVGAKINGKMMPILTQLRNGDIVEILTSDNAKGPSRDWLKFVKSSAAKNKIQQWFKKAQRQENIEKGKESIEREIKRIGMTHVELFKPEYLKAALERYKYNNIEDMYSSIGFGAISPTKIISRMLEEYRKEHKEENIEEKIEELSHSKSNTGKPSKSGIIVKGIDNCLIKLSKCCNPLPGDAIVGYITKGRGVSVHRQDCINVKQLVSEENRMIEVEWYNQGKAKYNVDVEVLANDRKGLLSDVIKRIDDTKSLLMGVNTKTTKQRIAILEISLEIENLEELNKVIKALNLVDSVFEVRRKK